MHKRVFFCLLVFVLVFTVSASAKGKKFKHADKNKDGVVDKKEWKMQKKWEHRQRSRVNNKFERKYDADGDGWLEPSEAKKLLEDKWQLIKTEGKAKVDCPIEAEYDINSNGIIDYEEAQAMKEDLQ